MQIQKIINQVKEYYKGSDPYTNKKIDDEKSRDKILFGNPFQDCTGIIVCCWANIHVINEAIHKNVNLIICHESLFYNHGDHTEWLQESQNKTFLKKIKLLQENNIVVYRNHDYIHSGILTQQGYVDGIFYGFFHKLKWESYLPAQTNFPIAFEIPKTSLSTIIQKTLQSLPINGLRIAGNPDSTIQKVGIAFHIWGIPTDNNLIKWIEEKNINLLIVGETVDFTVNEYIQDSFQCHKNISLLNIGHFNIEEPGMEYMLTYLPKLIHPSIPCYFISSTDMYQYYTK